MVKGKENLHLEVIEVSLNSIVGFTSNHTMKVKGEIIDRNVLLIDSGAIHNFLFTQVAEQLRVKLIYTGSYRVMMGTGKVELSRGICRGLKLTIQGIQMLYWE